MSKEIVGIKVLFKATTDFVSLFRLQGQLGLGEDRIHVCTPCLLSSSQLAEVTQIQAGDSYSAAITGESIIQPLRAIHTKNYKDTYSLTHRMCTPHSFCFLAVTISKSPLLRKTTVITSELAAYMLEMANFVDRDLDILMPGLFSACLSLSPKQVS